MAEVGSGLIVLAMGKMGAGELNYSSDIDLIVLFDPAAHDAGRRHRAAAVLRARDAGLVRLLQQRTGDGYVFRVDLRLRPDPASTPVAISRTRRCIYYERKGEPGSAPR